MAEARKAVEDIARLSSRVVRVLAQNPGPYTLAGTNTYLVHAASKPASQPSPSILVDTGEGVDSYIPLLERALRGDEGQAEPVAETKSAVTWISDIILTHRHHDHVGGLKSVLALLSKLRSESNDPLPAPRIRKFPDSDTDPALMDLLRSLPSDSFTAHSSNPLWPLKEGSTVKVQDATLQVIHTPGHTADHICLFLEEEQILLTGDHVLGQGTTVFEDLSAYLRSLVKCSNMLSDLGSGENLLFPAHGPVVTEGRKVLQTYLDHRLERERQILDLLATEGEEGKSWKIRQMVLNLYSNYPENLFPAAARGLFLHLQALATKDTESGRTVRARCLQMPSYASSIPGPCPPMPKNEQEWIEVMDADWSLVSPNEKL